MTPSSIVAIFKIKSLLALVDYWFVRNEWLGIPCNVIGQHSTLTAIGQPAFNLIGPTWQP
jgi:hypothetical protein